MHTETVHIGKHKAILTSMILETPSFHDDGRPAVIICPGGSYLYVSDREAEVVGLEFLNQGYNVFILKYSTMGTNILKEKGSFYKEDLSEVIPSIKPDTIIGSEFPNPLIELALSMQYIRENCKAFEINPCKIGVVGFSAGGHLAASLSVHWNKQWLLEKVGCLKEEIEPNFAILSYPILDFKLNVRLGEAQESFDPYYVNIVMRATFGNTGLNSEFVNYSIVKDYVDHQTPPTFMWHTVKDELVYVQNVLDYALSLEKYKVPWELHTFSNGGHGLSLARKTTDSEDTRASNWTLLMFSWLEEMGI